MDKRLYIVRHCAASGQDPTAPLTPAGQAQALLLADRLASAGIDRVVSSPFRRALDSIAPLAHRLGLVVEQDVRLVERVLSTADLPDWQDHLRATFTDPDMCLPGGESSRAAQARGVAAVTTILRQPATTPLLVSHGNLIALLLQHFAPQLGFDTWRALTNPDVYLVTLTPGAATIRRVWS